MIPAGSPSLEEAAARGSFTEPGGRDVRCEPVLAAGPLVPAQAAGRSMASVRPARASWRCSATSGSLALSHVAVCAWVAVAFEQGQQGGAANHAGCRRRSHDAPTPQAASSGTGMVLSYDSRDGASMRPALLVHPPISAPFTARGAACSLQDWLAGCSARRAGALPAGDGSTAGRGAHRAAAESCALPAMQACLARTGAMAKATTQGRRRGRRRWRRRAGGGRPADGLDGIGSAGGKTDPVDRWAKFPPA